MDFAALLEESNTVSTCSLAGNSQKMYSSNLRMYEEHILQVSGFGDPYPITVDKLLVFFTYLLKTKKYTYNTLRNYLSSFSHYFRENELENLTLSTKIKKFFMGAKREIYGETPPNRAEPAILYHFEEFKQKIDMKTL